jgi:hypothetical protein
VTMLPWFPGLLILQCFISPSNSSSNTTLIC